MDSEIPQLEINAGVYQATKKTFNCEGLWFVSVGLNKVEDWASFYEVWFEAHSVPDDRSQLIYELVEKKDGFREDDNCQFLLECTSGDNECYRILLPPPSSAIG
jgi:hypothetical protein